MSRFVLTGFGDEIHPALDVQMDVLESLGIDHIELRGVDGAGTIDYTPAQARRIRERMRARGFSVSAIGSPIGKIGIRDDFAPHLEAFKRLLDSAREMETQYIRLFSFFIPEGEDPALYRDDVLERMAALAQAAQGSGVTLLHENEKHIYGDVPERCLEILTALPAIKATFDPSNFVQCGVDAAAAFQALRPYIVYMHIKDSVYTDKRAALDMGFDTVSDAHRPAGQGHGQIPWMLEELWRTGFCGFLSLEPHLTHNADIPGSHADKFRVAAAALEALLERVKQSL